MDLILLSECLEKGFLSCGHEGNCTSPEDICIHEVECLNQKGEIDCRHFIAQTEAALDANTTEEPVTIMTDSPMVTIMVDNNGVINSLQNANISHAQPREFSDHELHPTEMTPLLESKSLR